MYVKNEICNEIYEKLFNYALSKINIISFSFYTIPKENYVDYMEKLYESEKSFKKALKNFIIKEILQESIDREENKDYVYTYKTYYLRYTTDVFNYLMINKNIYKWLNPTFPANIELYKENECWLYSIGHELDCCVYPENEEEYEYLKSIGIKFYEKKFKPVSKEELITIDLDSN